MGLHRWASKLTWTCAVPGLPEEEEWVDVDDAGKSMEGSCASAEAGCCSHDAHTNTEAGTDNAVDSNALYLAG